MFISFSDQKKIANVAFFWMKNPYSINIYEWDNTAAEIEIFWGIWLENLRDW